MLTFFQLPDTEYISEYRPGGLHPVHPGDTFHAGRYTVVHKLGCGAYATVWLVEDHTAGGYAALKILKADSDGHEIEIVRRIQTDAFEHVMRVLDLFQHVGPNGTHWCIVMEVLGPSLADAEEDLDQVYPEIGTYPPEVAQSIAVQIARAVQELHEAGIVHGDLSLRNVLLYSPVVASWSCPADVDEYMIDPQEMIREIRLREPDEVAPPSSHRPSYTIYGRLSTDVMLSCFTDPQNVRVKLCDFGESFFCGPGHTDPRHLHVPRAYASPEVLLKLPVGPPADVWALAVLVHDLIAWGRPLFAVCVREYRLDIVFVGMVLRKGKLPEPLWALWEGRGKYFDDDGGWIGDEKDNPWSITAGEPVHAAVTEKRCGDVSAFTRMIGAMTEYDPEQRASVQEVLRLMTALWIQATATEA